MDYYTPLPYQLFSYDMRNGYTVPISEDEWFRQFTIDRPFLNLVTGIITIGAPEHIELNQLVQVVLSDKYHINLASNGFSWHLKWDYDFLEIPIPTCFHQAVRLFRTTESHRRAQFENYRK